MAGVKPTGKVLSPLPPCPCPCGCKYRIEFGGETCRMCRRGFHRGMA